MIVSFVFEHEEPILLLSVDLSLDLYGAGVDLLGFIEVFENAGPLQIFCGYRRDIHKSYGAVLAGIQKFAFCYVVGVGFLYIIRSDIYR